MSDSVIRRYRGNPILTAKDIPFECLRCYNPAAFKFRDKYMMLVRVWGEGRRESVGLAVSDDGYHFTVEPSPVLLPSPADQGRLNDCRVTEIDGEFYVCYCSDPEDGIRIGILKTDDFHHFEHVYYSEPDNRNAVLFPEKINGLYVRLDRPFARQYFLDRPYDFWISYSPDMRFWGNHKKMLGFEQVAWGSNKIGPGPQPIKTDRGWLVIYHGAEVPDPQKPGWNKVYRAGILLCDLNDPTKIIAKPPMPLLSPEEWYETNPEYRDNIVFPTGVIAEPDGGVKIYYGASDNCICLAESSIDELLDFCLNPRPYTHTAAPGFDRSVKSRHA